MTVLDLLTGSVLITYPVTIYKYKKTANSSFIDNLNIDSSIVLVIHSIFTYFALAYLVVVYGNVKIL